MANVAGRPFLELLLQQLTRQDFSRVILAVGYQGELIRSYFAENAPDLQIVYSTEMRPLGTAGAIRNASEVIGSDSVLVMNGDSYTDVNLAEFVDFYAESKADASLVLVSAEDRTDCGFVLLNAENKVAGFDEKHPNSATRYVNAGIYLLSSSLICGIPAAREMSLEREVIPIWLKNNRTIVGFVHHGTCIDIGTPDRYRSAQTALAAVESNPSSARV
jgi:mannose-1-phosphate guanylyltransferase